MLQVFITCVSENILQRSTGRVALAALLFFLVFLVVVLPRQASQSESYASQVGSPDQSFLYSPDELYAMAEAYGPGGRQAYIQARFTFDLVWPLIYLAFLSTSLGWLSSRLFEPSSRWRTLVMLPWLGCLFDYLENLAAAVVMARFPDLSPWPAAFAPVFTFLKWSSIGMSFAALLSLLIGWIRVRLRGKPATG